MCKSHSRQDNIHNCCFLMMSLLIIIILTITDKCSSAIVTSSSHAIASPLSSQIKVINAPGTNVALDYRVSSEYIVVDITTKVHNWWLMKLTGVNGKTIKIGFSMSGKGDVSKWKTLHPVYTYAANINDISAYTWFRKDRGRWNADNTFLPSDLRGAGMGSIPNQAVIPTKSSSEFLSTDGCYWEPWGHISNVEIVPNLDIFRFTATFSQDSVWIAMRYPFSNLLLDSWIDKLKTINNIHCHVNTIGLSQEGRKLYLIDCTSNADMQMSPLTIFLYAHEDGTEPDGSWALFGIVQDILNKKIQHWPRILLMPIVDPDSLAANRYEGMIDSFTPSKSSVESTSIARYLRQFGCQGLNIDITVSLHNTECDESNNIWVPTVDFLYNDYSALKRKQLYDSAKSFGYSLTDYIELSGQSSPDSGTITIDGIIDYESS